MKIHHVIVETLKKVELVSTAKIMDILLVGALRNVWIDMRRRLNRDEISESMHRKQSDQIRERKNDERIKTSSMIRKAIMESIQLYSNHFRHERIF
jgi:hypothetical protein